VKKRIVILGLCLSLVAAMIPGVVLAATEGTVTCTVSGSLVAITVTDGTVAYGVLALSGTQDTLAANLDDQQTASNDGTVAVDLTIKSSNATREGGTAWTLSNTAIGANQYMHKFSINGGTTWTAMTTSDQALASDIAAAGSEAFDLQIHMPSSTTDYLQHAITVTVTASES